MATELGNEDWKDEGRPRNPDREFRVSVEVGKTRGKPRALVHAHDGAGGKVLLAQVTESEILMFPLVSASYSPDFLKPRHGKIKTIRIPASITKWGWDVPDGVYAFDEMIGGLPVGFSRHARRGLGLRDEYVLITDAISGHTDCSELLIEEGDGAAIDGAVFRLGVKRFTRVRKAIYDVSQRSGRRSLQERRLLAFNEVLSEADAARFPKQDRKPKPGEIYELVKLGSRDARRSAEDRKAAAAVVKQDAREMVREDPVTLMELRSEIEKVTLGELIGKFELLLGKNPVEGKWQKFFEANPFVLSVAFPYPAALICGQAHVGGTRIDGGGEVIADFLFKRQVNGGLAIFEIKTARTPLVEAKAFRGDLHAPRKELCEAMAQALHQRSTLLRHFHERSRDPGMEGTHVSHVHCLVIAGRTPDTPNKIRSLDLFRNASKDVVVATFDELLGKLKAIHSLMGGLPAPAAKANP